MDYKDNKDLLPYAKSLRKNMTKEENRIWYQYLKNRPETILRQKIIGHYIVDFYCAKVKLVIEIDGGQHNLSENKEYDERRTKYLENYGIKVVRFTNLQINQYFLKVCRCLDFEISEGIKRNS